MIYCVEDDNAIRELMLYTLGASGFQAKGFPDSIGFWQAMTEEKPELILLDIMLPGEDGITVLKRLRAASATANIPVIMATAKGSEFDKVIGLDTGADDYLVKPFGMMEMIARIKAVMRRTAPKTDQVLTCGDIVLDETRHIVTVDGKQVVLTLKEYELLKLLMENAGQVFTWIFCSLASGDRTIWEKPEPWTCTSALCARSLPRAGRKSKPSGALAIRWWSK